MMGVGEGVTYPSIQNLVRQRVPEQKRSRALAFIYSGAPCWPSWQHAQQRESTSRRATCYLCARR